MAKKERDGETAKRRNGEETIAEINSGNLKNNEEPESSSQSMDSPVPDKNFIEEIEKIKEKLTQSENQYLRLLADYQNLQKRTAQEKEDLYKYAAQKTIEIILPALDTFEYAKTTVNPDATKEKLIEDFNLVFETLLKTLKEIGLKPIDETGIAFNPVYHEPLHQIPTNELPDHTVMQILKKGYMLNDKVIRPALVSVSVRQQKEGPPEQIASG